MFKRFFARMENVLAKPKTANKEMCLSTKSSEGYRGMSLASVQETHGELAFFPSSIEPIAELSQVFVKEF